MLVVALAVGSGSAAVACKSTVENPNHCVNQMGDAWCEQHFGAEKPYCILDACVDGATPERGCVATRPSDECWSPCGDASYAADPLCEGIATATDTETGMTMGPASNPSTSTTEDPTMGPGPGPGTETSDPTTDDPTMVTTGPTGCDGDEDCTEGDERFCVDEICVACDATNEPDVECAGLGGGETPVCFDGGCVACTEENAGACTGTTPICDVATNSCTECTFHEQCQALDMPACHIAEGSCITASTEVNAGNNGTIQPAIDLVAAATPHAIVLTGGGGLHTVDVDSSKIIAIVADPDGPEREIRGQGGAATLTVTGGGAVGYLHRVRLLGNTGGTGITATSGAALYADNAQIVQNSDGGLQVSGSADAFMRNCMVALNGEQFDASTGIRVTNSTLDLLYTSVGINDGNSADSLQCDAASTVTVRNSLLVGSDPDSTACVGMAATFSAFDQAVAGNDDVGTIDIGWFPNWSTGDLSLSASGEATFGDIAQWQTGDPPTDFEGDLRPDMNGTMDVAGADVP